MKRTLDAKDADLVLYRSHLNVQLNMSIIDTLLNLLSPPFHDLGPELVLVLVPLPGCDVEILYFAIHVHHRRLADMRNVIVRPRALVVQEPDHDHHVIGHDHVPRKHRIDEYHHIIMNMFGSVQKRRRRLVPNYVNERK